MGESLKGLPILLLVFTQVLKAVTLVQVLGLRSFIISAI